MGFHLGHGVHGDSHHNKKGSSAKIKGYIKLVNKYRRQNTHCSDIEGSAQGNPGEHPVNVIRGFLTRSYSRNIATVLFHIISHINRVEDNRSVKIAKEDNKNYIEQII